jgi:hypothetical protein
MMNVEKFLVLYLGKYGDVIAFGRYPFLYMFPRRWMNFQNMLRRGYIPKGHKLPVCWACTVMVQFNTIVNPSA